MDLEQKLQSLGFVDHVFAGIQIDVNAVRQKVEGGSRDAPLCDHSCVQEVDGKPTGGNYTCPASFVLNKGVERKFATKDQIIESIRRTGQALLDAKEHFLSSPFFDSYLQESHIPPAEGRAINALLRKGKIEVNLFGGNPEMHPNITDIVGAAKESGYLINLTTTGRKFMEDPSFADRFVAQKPDLLAMSADQINSTEQILHLSRLSLEELKKERRALSPYQGQLQKLYEGFYTAKLGAQRGDFPMLLFNMVIQKDNVNHLEELIGALQELVPNVKLNPYPAQSSFDGAPALFKEEHLEPLSAFIDKVVENHQPGKKNIFKPRLHYWLMLKAAVETLAPQEAVRALSGYDVWKCYSKPGAGMYIQIGASPKVTPHDRLPGGHLGCFWNTSTTTDNERQVWNMSPTEIDAYIKGGVVDIAKSSDNACGGCIMPRLVFNVMSAELGMNEKLVPVYRRLRMEHAGF